MKGFVVEHLRTGVRYAVSEENIDPTHERVVRPLSPGETVIGFKPKTPDATRQPSSSSKPAITKDKETK